MLVHVLPAVGALDDVGLVVAALPVVERGEHRVRIARRGEDVGDVGPLRHAGELLDLAPVLPAVLGHLHEPIVGADVEQPFEQRRLVDRHDVAERRRRRVARDRVSRPELAHDRDLVAIEVAGEVRADARPVVAAIVGAVDVVRRPVETPRRVRADDVRRVPVDAIGAARGRRGRPAGRPARLAASAPAALPARLAHRGARRARVAAAALRLPARHLVVAAAAAEALRARRTNRPADAGAQVEARDAAVLRRRVDDVGILGIVARLEAVAAGDDVPVARAHAEAAHVPRRAAEGEVVLRPAADVVERLGVVDREAVELRDGQVREEAPGRALVVRLVEPAVVAEQDVIAVRRIELDARDGRRARRCFRSASSARSCRRRCSARR